MDCRVKPGNDVLGVSSRRQRIAWHQITSLFRDDGDRAELAEASAALLG
jgi:hypothetical protein